MVECKLAPLCKVQNLLTFRVPKDLEPIAGEPLPLDNSPHLLREVSKSLSAAALMVELAHREGPAGTLVSAMFADHTVEPPLDPAGQAEVFAVDGKGEAILK